MDCFLLTRGNIWSNADFLSIGPLEKTSVKFHAWHNINDNNGKAIQLYDNYNIGAE